MSHDPDDDDDPVPLAIVDVHYAGGGATAACVVAAQWTDPSPIESHVVAVAPVAPYAPGRFYERELPSLLAVLAEVRIPIRAVVIDGYVRLDERGAPGLGAHLHAALGGRTIVIGVAKTAFRGSAFATPVLRGGSKRPLYVTAAGIDGPPAHAARLVAAMHGPHRIPTLLAWVDRLAAGRPPPVVK